MKKERIEFLSEGYPGACEIDYAYDVNSLKCKYLNLRIEGQTSSIPLKNVKNLKLLSNAIKDFLTELEGEKDE